MMPGEANWPVCPANDKRVRTPAEEGQSTSAVAINRYTVIDSRSWTTVASGPEPNAGSAPKRRNTQGNAMATSVAIEQLATSESPTATATRPSPQTSRANGRKAAPSAGSGQRLRERCFGQPLALLRVVDFGSDGPGLDTSTGPGSDRYRLPKCSMAFCAVLEGSADASQGADFHIVGSDRDGARRAVDHVGHLAQHDAADMAVMCRAHGQHPRFGLDRDVVQARGGRLRAHRSDRDLDVVDAVEGDLQGSLGLVMRDLANQSPRHRVDEVDGYE